MRKDPLNLMGALTFLGNVLIFRLGNLMKWSSDHFCTFAPLNEIFILKKVIK